MTGERYTSNKIPGLLLARATKFWTVVPNIFSKITAVLSLTYKNVLSLNMHRVESTRWKWGEQITP
jgi:hypothetical protein